MTVAAAETGASLGGAGATGARAASGQPARASAQPADDTVPPLPGTQQEDQEQEERTPFVRPTNSVVETGSGLLLGAILWAVAINWLRGGPAQARGWVLAKLVNKPYGAAAPGQAAPTAPAPSV